MSIMVTYGPKFLGDNVVRELCKKDLLAIRIPASKGQPLQQLEQIAKDLPNDTRIVVDIPGEKHRLNNDDILVLTEGEILNFEKENAEIQGTKLSLFHCLMNYLVLVMYLLREMVRQHLRLFVIQESVPVLKY